MSRTIEIEIACYITPTGAWSAFGSSEFTEHRSHALEGLGDRYDEEPMQLVHVKATVPVPNELVPINIQGQADVE